MTLSLAAFWVGATLLAWVYLGYPLLARLFGAMRPVSVAGGTTWPALVTVGIAVHNGADQIAARIANVLSQATPFELEVVIASDGSTDDTVARAMQIARTDSRIRLIELSRIGQAGAQAAIFEAALGEIVALTDVETRFADGCLEALVAPFADPRVGCVTGVLDWRYAQLTETANHEGLYWRYEQAVRAWESRAGWLSAATGALMAVRRTLFRPVPVHASLDQMLPLLAAAAHQLVVVEPRAAASDRGTSGPTEQFRSRERIATQGIEANLRMALHVRPWRRPGCALAIWSHKLLRWATPYLALSVLASGAALTLAGGGPVYGVAVAAAAVLALVATMAYVVRSTGRRVPLAGFALTVFSVNLAFALAWVNVLLRRRNAAWES
jgi:cellulose synthase/poly-beta-1,6-N-acetylglucosamine synthase-like glycosyltransferase